MYKVFRFGRNAFGLDRQGKPKPIPFVVVNDLTIKRAQKIVEKYKKLGFIK